MAMIMIITRHASRYNSEVTVTDLEEGEAHGNFCSASGFRDCGMIYHLDDIGMLQLHAHSHFLSQKISPTQVRPTPEARPDSTHISPRTKHICRR